MTMNSSKNYSTLLGPILVFLLLVLCFTGVYKPNIVVEKVNTNYLTIFLSIICLFVILFSPKRKVLLELFFYNRFLICYFSILVLCFAVSFLRLYIYDVGEKLLVSVLLKQSLIFLLSTLIFSVCLYLVISQLNYKAVIIGCGLFCLFSLVLSISQLAFYDFKYSVISFTSLDQYWKDFALSSSRGIGFQGLSIWDSSIAYAALYLVISISWRVGTVKGNICFYFIFFLLILLTLLSGRTGFLLLVYMHILIGVYYKKYFELITLLVTVFFIGSFLYEFSTSDKIREIIEFSFELFINIFSGSISTGSTDDLINNHLFLPQLNNLFFGDNIYIGDGDVSGSLSSRSSDSAFVIYYKAFGLLGVVFTVSMLTCMSLHISLMLSKIFDSHQKLIRLASFLFVLALFIKVPIHASSTLLKVISFVSIFTLCYKKNNLKQEDVQRNYLQGH